MIRYTQVADHNLRDLLWAATQSNAGLSQAASRYFTKRFQILRQSIYETRKFTIAFELTISICDIR